MCQGVLIFSIHNLNVFKKSFFSCYYVGYNYNVQLWKQKIKI